MWYYGGRWGQITKSVGLVWTGLVSPFCPIPPPIFPWELSPMHPHPIALLSMKTMFFDLFSPQIPNFSIEHPTFPTVFPISPRFPPLFPISPHFPPFLLGSVHQCTPTIALVPIKTMFLGLFGPPNSPFFHRASKILLLAARHLEEVSGTTILEPLRRGNCTIGLCPRPLGSHPPVTPK